MQLTYRGAKYQTQTLPNLNLSTSEVTGKYRGKASELSPYLRVFSKSLAMFTYRGIGYSKEVNCNCSSKTSQSTESNSTQA
ncbi:DUF4278 domain-containing protein [Myxosarcina sp. GI1]|uniref:DUF4278 domain-containing protein n=1 Tax=Myxosarcina sp. GI1 TaxID=1541065 RepID=UPI0005633329|nr:DUF4278 domain-containing protein [Myxosarcina sp. GI1]